MGASSFYKKVKGTDARNTFKELREDAQYESGHGGYSGTIAEKHSYTMSKKPTDIDVDIWWDLVDEFDEDDKTQPYYRELKHDSDIYQDKWGPALCIPTEGGFVFCGYASS
jgi:hypothetical protein